MVYNVIQKIHNNYYLYQVTDATWDSEKKNSKQDRKYLGPCDKDGNLQEERRKKKKPQTEPPKKLYWSKSFGQYYLLKELADKSGISKSLIDAFGEEAGKDILALAIMRIAQPTSLRTIEDSIESTYLRELIGIDTSYSSQRMTEITRSIGDNEDSRMKYCSAAVKKSDVIIFDTTVLKSSSRLFDMLEYGRKYKKTGLPQVNMGYVHSLNTGMPVYYKLYPGSISDSITITNLIKELKGMGCMNQQLVMDRGFFSEDNIRTMFSQDYGFVIPVPSGNSIFKTTLSSVINDLENPMNMFRFHGRTEFYAETTVDMPYDGIVDSEGNPVKTLRIITYQNNDRRKDEIDTIAERLDSIEHESSEMDYSKENVERLFDGYNRDLRQLFDISEKEGKIFLERKRNAITFAMRKCGRLMLVTTIKDKPEDILEIYHLRDSVEKDYEMLKDDMDGGIEYVRDTTTAEGIMFIQFIATGLRMYMNSIVSKIPELRKLDIPLILRKLNLITVSKIDEVMIISEIGKKQRDILEAFGVETPTMI